MKKLAILLVLTMFVLASGCGYYQAKKAEKDAYEHLDKVQAQADEMEKQMAKTTTAMEDMERQTATQRDDSYDEGYDEDEETPTELHIPGSGGESGDTVGLQKLGTQYRDKDATERCDLDYPFTCMSYIASEGRVDITIKYMAYDGKLEDVTLFLDGDYCDPDGTDIEPGQKQKFTCYTDEEGSQLRGNLELEYFETLVNLNKQATGSIVANWE